MDPRIANLTLDELRVFASDCINGLEQSLKYLENPEIIKASSAFCVPSTHLASQIRDSLLGLK